MKDSIGGLWLLGIIMVFMVLMIAFVSISINYSRVFRLKSEMLSVIEESQGFNNKSRRRIAGLIEKYGYTHKKTCSFTEKTTEDHNVKYSNMIGIDVDDNKVYKNNYNKSFSYCVIRLKNRNQRQTSFGVVNSNVNSDDYEYFYTVQLAFGFDLPVLGDLITFRVTGETRGIIYAVEDGFANVFG